MNKIVVTIRIFSRKREEDIEVPVDITANDFVVAVNEAYKLGIDTNNVQNCFLKTENPIALLKGNRTLEEFGMHNGSIIIVND